MGEGLGGNLSSYAIECIDRLIARRGGSGLNGYMADWLVAEQMERHAHVCGCRMDRWKGRGVNSTWVAR